MQTITSTNKTKNAIKKFRDILSNISNEEEYLDWSFPSAGKGKGRQSYLTYTIKTTYGDLYVATSTKQWNHRTPFLFRFKESNSLSPDVEINIPEELNRQVAGVFCERGKSIFLCSRGHFTANPGKIKNEYTYNHFVNWLENTNDDSKQIELILICSLDSKSIANDLAHFIQEVLSLKNRYKSKNKLAKNSKIIWNSGDEFEGEKSFTTKATAVKYEYSHGAICNALEKYLSSLKIKELFTAKNKHIDLALVNPKTKKANYIFEVKTASLPSDQIYSAVGQLLYYKHLYGYSNTKLFLTLPDVCSCKKTEKYLNAIEITIIYAKDQKFFFSNKKSFQIK